MPAKYFLSVKGYCKFSVVFPTPPHQPINLMDTFFPLLSPSYFECNCCS